MNDHEQAEQHLQQIATKGNTRTISITRCQSCGLGNLYHHTMREDGENFEVLACDHCTWWT